MIEAMVICFEGCSNESSASFGLLNFPRGKFEVQMEAKSQAILCTVARTQSSNILRSRHFTPACILVRRNILLIFLKMVNRCLAAGCCSNESSASVKVLGGE